MMTRLALTAAGLLLAAQATAADMKATYAVTFDGTWSQATHPKEYPGSAHFSGLIGATHAEGYTLFKEGGTATDGLEKLAETGSHSPLNQEIQAAIRKGAAARLLETGPLFNLPAQIKLTFDIDAAHPMVSLVAMIAPSPDWFAGAASLKLLENGQWVARQEVTVYAYDAGTDDGVTYQAADIEVSPRQPIARNRSAHFQSGNAMVPVGKLVFERMGAPAKSS